MRRRAFSRATRSGARRTSATSATAGCSTGPSSRARTDRAPAAPTDFGCPSANASARASRRRFSTAAGRHSRRRFGAPRPWGTIRCGARRAAADDDGACDRGGLAARLVCVATYGGDARDTVLNDAAVVAAVLATLARGPRGPRLLVVAGLVAFQFGLCLAVGCAGVSVVWAALAGVVALDAAAPPRHLAARGAVLACVLALAAYYAITAPLLTTVAHACAFALGALLHRLVLRRPPPRAPAAYAALPAGRTSR